MSKYLYVYTLSLQNVLQRRASLLMDRVGGIATLLALYFFWSSIFKDSATVAGYPKAQMLTYVLMMSLLRSLVFTGRGWEVVGEISSGRLSNYLIRPIRYLGYCLSLDLAQKTVHCAAAVFEISILILVLGAPFHIPQSPQTWVLFPIIATFSTLLFFLLEFLVASLAFWTSESGGPLFCFDLLVQFLAGAFFPLDVLPRALQAALYMTPFPYLVFFPIDVYLERAPTEMALKVLATQGAWLVVVGMAAATVWRRGLRNYAAEGG
ncbi:MAG: ABC-2 family transporter protein [Elusimicrobia bacterium]|nr:ABC-2 family transporter protein [Elusimicrobiota bacterium]